MRPAGRTTPPPPPSPAPSPSAATPSPSAATPSPSAATPSPSAATPSPSNLISFDEKKAGETGSTAIKANTELDFTTPTSSDSSPAAGYTPTPSNSGHRRSSNVFSNLSLPSSLTGSYSSTPQRPSSGVFSDSFFQPPSAGSAMPRTETNLSTNPNLPGSSIRQFNLDTTGMSAIQEAPRGTAFDMESKEDRLNHAKSRLEAYAAQAAEILSRRTKPSAPTNAVEFDRSIKGPSTRTNEEIKKNMDYVKEYTGMQQQIAGPYSPVTFSTLIAEDPTKTPDNFDDIGIPDYLAIETTYTPGKNQSSMSVDLSARNQTNDPLPYDTGHSLPQASDAYNAHLNMGTQWDKLREGEITPRFPADIVRDRVMGSEAVILINEIFNRHIIKDSERLDEDDGTLTLRMNREPKNQEEVSETMDLLRILDSTVNGKSTVNWIRDFNNLNNTQHSIDSVDINMGTPHSYEKTKDLDTPNLKFHISPDLTSHFLGSDAISNPGSPHESFAGSDISSQHSNRAEDPVSPNPNQEGVIARQPLDSPNPVSSDTAPPREPADVISPNATDTQESQQQVEINQRNSLNRSITSVLNFCVQCLHLLGGSRAEDNSSS